MSDNTEQIEATEAPETAFTDALSETENELDPMRTIVSIDDYFTVPLAKVPVAELRKAFAELLENRNTLAVHYGNIETELGNARIRVSRMNLDRTRDNQNNKRVIGQLSRQITALTRLSNYNASRCDLPGDVLSQASNALLVYATPENWKDRELIVADPSVGGAVYAQRVINDPVCATVINDNESRMRVIEHPAPEK